MEEVKDPAANPTETGKKDGGKKTLTLEEVAAELTNLKTDNEKIKKQNADKDAFITKVTGENKELRDTLKNLSATLSGKSETQKDAYIEAQRKKFLDKGYDEETVDLILDTIDGASERKADKKLASVIMDATEGLIESDPEIEKDFMEKNADNIKAEFDSYRLETTPRKIKANLKKAYNAVKERLAEAEKKDKPEPDRDKKIKGQSPEEKSQKKPDEAEKEFIDGIVGAGTGGGHFV